MKNCFPSRSDLSFFYPHCFLQMEIHNLYIYETNLSFLPIQLPLETVFKKHISKGLIFKIELNMKSILVQALIRDPEQQRDPKTRAN